MRPKRKVFISYARKDDTSAEVGELVRWLKTQEGIEVISDHLFPYRAPPQGWYAWMQHSIESADIVLCICGETFKEGFEKKGDSGGVRFEGDIINTELHARWNKKIHPILPWAGGYEYVPKSLRPWENNISLVDRSKILHLIREGQTGEQAAIPHPLPRAHDTRLAANSSPLKTEWKDKKWIRKNILAPISVFVAVLAVFVTIIRWSPAPTGVAWNTLTKVDPSETRETILIREVFSEETAEPAPKGGDTPTKTENNAEKEIAPQTETTQTNPEPSNTNTKTNTKNNTKNDRKSHPAKSGTAANNSGGTAVNNPGGTVVRNLGGTAAGNPGGTATDNPGGTAAGNPGGNEAAPPEGAGSAVSFRLPHSISVDRAGNLYVADSSNERIHKVTPSGVVSRLAGSARWGFPHGMAMDSAGNLYITVSHRIRKITPSGTVSTPAGSMTAGFADGTGSAAQFHFPRGIAVDSAGNLYVADESNHRIRKVTPSGVVSTLAGSTAGFADGTGSAAQFNSPSRIAIDRAGNLYVADNNNHRIRKITPSGIVSTLAGSRAGFADGAGSAARFNSPRGIAIDSAGNLYVADDYNHRIRKVTPSGVVSTLAGSKAGFADGTGRAAQFHHPRGIAIDAAGRNLYVADAANNRIRKLSLQGEVNTLADNRRPGSKILAGASSH